MILILIDKNRHRSKYLSDKLKNNYNFGKVHHLSSIDKVKELSQMIRYTENYGIAKEIQKIWKSYNKAMADDIVDYIRQYKEDNDIVLINIDDEEGVALFKEYCPFPVYVEFIGGAPESYIDKIYETILDEMQ